ncbi:cytochrome c oxidase assembly protein [Blastococcus saxobsidens]|uniref:Cytochrome c oxidase assembly factor CtaG n=1 Tax=Blastococcus saxobsidens TaxID=138336 RepID=A0A4Q7Y590_9ACTN|nr:cytochrome c oxidase assembly protein [Blastococcus saxobsidens]RZU32020.1 cytochrome c oxidase assembly factor CtaG [Blastococcus saxobsidens]
MTRPIEAVLAHEGAGLTPHELWTAWNADPLILCGLLLAAAAYLRGRSRGRGRVAEKWRARCFAGGLLAVAVAVLSPLDALSDALASAHMVQHLLLTLVAAPLLVLSVPAARLLRGSPSVVRRAMTPWRRLAPVAHALRHPGMAWLLHVGTFWAWHAAVLYDAAVEHPLVHALEHATFLLTGVLFWRTVLGVRAARVPAGLGVLLVFGMSMSSALLSLLLTFAQTPWYSGYATTTQVWGLEPLADQQLAGALMWVPAGLVHVTVALGLLITWIRGTEDGEAAATPVATGLVTATAGRPADRNGDDVPGRPHGG